MSKIERLGHEILFFDGAMGTQLQSRGLAAGEFPETWNITRPDEVLEIHRSYLAAGCDVIKTNTFGANELKFDGTGYTPEELITAGVALARKAAKEYGAAVALSLGSLGRLLAPIGELAFESAVSAFARSVRAGANAGADMILFETISDTYEMKAALLAAKETCSLPVALTMMLDENGRLLTGGDAAAAAALLDGLGANALGLNCGLGPDVMIKLLPALMQASDLPIIVNPNAGLPRVLGGETVYGTQPDAFADGMKELVLMGACAVGGCCGTTPEHIRRMIRTCRGMEVLPVTKKHRTVVSSYTHALDLGERPIIIGERINPTGKARFKQALREDDTEFILREALTQHSAGAHILDVNVGLPEIDEAAVMERTVAGIQAVCDLPLQIDTSDPEAMERALRIYNGKPLLNSVSGKRESMDVVFPLAKKYGAAVVCLCLDENGIPESVDGRVAIARNIIASAREYGIDKKDLLIDTLVLTVSTGADNALVTLGVLRKVKEELGVCTVLGVSNVSFGLPERACLNTAFFTLALGAGLDAGIVNPSSEPMMDAYYSFNALSANDSQCARYIARHSAGQDASPPASDNRASGDDGLSLRDAIIRGLAQSAHTAAARLLEDGEDAVTVIDRELVPALDTVGRGFENRSVYLPSLLMSAEAAKAAFAAIKERLAATGEKRASKGKIVIATVRGDIHDIGKNIVRALLENYGFDVSDLGRDVLPEAVVGAAGEKGARLIALSALMTTTVPAMEETIRLARETLPDCRIMVGGAVLTPEYAKMIGADSYSPDAMGAVRYACSLSEQGLL